MKISFYTLGCKLNQVETEAVASAFREEEFELVPFNEPADITVINTCTVTSKSEQKARRMIRKIARENPGSAVLVTGCYAEMDGEEVNGLEPNVMALPLRDKERLLDLPSYLKGFGASGLKERLGLFFSGKTGFSDPFRFVPDEYTYHSRAFLKIQDGCDNLCSYCRVRLARGPSLSMDPDRILEALTVLSERNYSEVVLTGVNLDSYNKKGCDLSGLIKRIIGETEGFRVRLSSLNPDAVTGSLAETLRFERVCPHFHLAAQSGSDDILRSMRRNYKAEKIIEAVKLLRSVKDDPFIAMDIITGFPGESDKHFGETLTVLKNIKPAALHIFPFSPRPGTEAEKMKPAVPDIIVKERLRILRGLSLSGTGQYVKRWLNRPVEVVVEDITEPVRGISGNYLRFPFAGIPPKPDALCKAVLNEEGQNRVFTIIS